MTRLNRLKSASVFLVLVVTGCTGFAEEITWNTAVTVSYDTCYHPALNADPAGKMFLVYSNDHTDTLASYTNHGIYSEYRTIADIDSPVYASSSIDFLGSLPIVTAYDYVSDHVETYIFYNDEWEESTQLPYTNGARKVVFEVSGTVYHVAFSYEVPGTGQYDLKYLFNTGADWTLETIARLSNDLNVKAFDMVLDSGGVPHFAWFDENNYSLKYAVRTGDDSFDVSEAYPHDVFCPWVKLAFLTVDIPFVGFLDVFGSGDETVRLAYQVGSSWYSEDIYSDSDIAAVDMAVDPAGNFVTRNFYFILNDSSGYQCVRREYSGWEVSGIGALSGLETATDLRAEWNSATGEVAAGIVVNSRPNTYFIKGLPVTPTPRPATPTPTVPPPTPTTGPGTPTHTPFPDPTSTPVSCPELGVSLKLPYGLYHPGDTFYCRATVCNPDPESMTDVPLFVVLDVYGQYWFAPSFSEFDYYRLQFEPGATVVDVIPPFPWPAGTGSASGILFHAGLTTPDMSELIGSYDSVSFGWEE